MVLDGKANPAFEGAIPGTDQFDIQADFGHRAGHNLFHSFERFSLRSSESAVFHGPAAIRNVISRVTGGERSKINGTIRSEIEGADFYFINPAGVLFGPRAFLEVTGSFHASTANVCAPAVARCSAPATPAPAASRSPLRKRLAFSARTPRR